VEEKLVEIWSAVLKRAPIGIRDDFFELGGHSLLATQLISRIRSAFNVELPLRRLFEYPRIVDLASVVLNLEQQTQTNVVEEVIPRSIDKNEADALLARIDQLSDAEVDLLLGNVMSEAGGGE
jgi:acyl carrier protein